MSYIITYYLPSGLFVVVSWISFLIPPDIVPGEVFLFCSFGHCKGSVPGERPLQSTNPAAQARIFHCTVQDCTLLFVSWYSLYSIQWKTFGGHKLYSGKDRAT